MPLQLDKGTLEDKVSGYTYNGLPIVIGKKRGRPPNKKKVPGWHSIEAKVTAACIYAVTGSLQEAENHTKITVPQLRSMMSEVWWDDTVKQVRKEENDQITAKMTKIVDSSLGQIEDRLTNGDWVLDKKTGEKSRLPVKMRDIAAHIGVLTDKRQLLRGEATSITERTSQEDLLKTLGDKFEKFARKASGVKEPEVMDVPFEEIKADVRS